MPSVCPTPFNISNAYPIPAPSSHWEFHVADAARRTVTMCSALPPTSSLACTLYWRHVLSVASSSSPLTSTASSRPLTSTWGFHVADAAHRGITMPSAHPLISLMFTLLTLGIPRSRCSTPWSHHVFCPTTYLVSCLHPLLAPGPST